MQTRLRCVSTDAAFVLANEADRPDAGHRATPDGLDVVVTYVTKRYPFVVASYAADNGYASDTAAAAVIAGIA
jgi:hypothetical protein